MLQKSGYKFNDQGRLVKVSRVHKCKKQIVQICVLDMECASGSKKVYEVEVDAFPMVLEGDLIQYPGCKDPDGERVHHKEFQFEEDCVIGKFFLV